MSALPPDAKVNTQETELLAQFSRHLHAPLLNTMGHPLASITAVPGLSPVFLRTHGLLPLQITPDAAHVAAAVPVPMAALDALRQFFPDILVSEAVVEDEPSAVEPEG